MIDQRFSVDDFARLRPDTREAEDLSAALAHAIATEMHKAIADAIRSVVVQVREPGHDLREVEWNPF